VDITQFEQFLPKQIFQYVTTICYFHDLIEIAMLYNALSCHDEFEGRKGTVRNIKITEAPSGYTYIFFPKNDLVFCFLDMILFLLFQSNCSFSRFNIFFDS